MWLRRLRIHAFGGLTDRELQLAPGLTVVHGPNESAKSTWHAALTVALCGRRRGAGRRQSDAAFEARHRPWDQPDRWAVGLDLVLDDGREIEIERDLLQQLVTVVDTGLGGRPVPDDLIRQGSPDGAVWLGLDRDTFPMTASVRQTELLAVAEHAEGLREHLAGAAAGGGVTAAAALERLTRFAKEHVGVDKANAVKPLRTALDASRAAEADLGEVRVRHGVFQELARSAEAARAELAQARQDEQVVRAAIARQRWQDAERRLERLEAMAAEFPEGEPAGADGLPVAEVAALLERADSMGEEPTNDLPAIELLEAQIATLPAAPEGPLTVPASVDDAVMQYRAALESVASTIGDALDDPSPEAEVDPTDVETHLRPLRQPTPDLHDLDARRDEETARIEARIISDQRRRRRAILGWALVVGSAGLALVGGLLAFTAAVLMAALGFGCVLRSRPVAAGDEPVVLAELDRQRSDAVELLEQQEAARAWLAARGLPTEVDAAMAEAIDRQLRVRSRESARHRQREREAHVESRRAAAVAVLGDYGIHHADPIQGLTQLQAQVRSNQEQAAAAAELERLMELRDRRAQFDVELASYRARRDELVAAMGAELDRHAPDHVASDEHELATALRRVLERWTTDGQARREMVRRWERLQHQLDGQTLDEHREAAARLRLTAEQELDASGGEVRSIQDPAVAARDAALQVSAAREHLDRALGGLEQIDSASVDVAAAEARVEETQAELARVRQLESTLALTRTFLGQAHEQAHRALAPVLEREMTRWISLITEGRYTAARVDPETLAVSLRDAGGRYRDGTRVSHGTAEQVHLVLRLVLAQLLTAGHDRCPVLLDDPTVHADDQRAVAALDYLREASREHQVVLFTQETRVVEWARERLDPDIDSMVALAGSSAQPDDGTLPGISHIA